MPSLIESGALFDVDGARKAGFTDTQIADQLGKMTNRFDVTGARDAGFGDEEIIHVITTGKGFDRSSGAGGVVAKGAVRGGLEAVGTLTDVVNPAMTALKAAGQLLGLDTKTNAERFREIPRQISGAVFGDPDILGYENVESLPPSMRPLAFGGELMGGSLPFAFAPIGIAKSGVQITGKSVFSREIGKMLDFARRNPKSFLAMEASSILGGAVAGGLAEATFPGETFIRLGAEVTGAVLNPGALLLGAGTGAVKSVKRATRSLSKSGQKKTAANYLGSVIEQFGEDPVALSQAIKHGEKMGIPLSPGLRTGSKALLAIEQKLASDSAALNNTLKKEVADALSTFRRAADTLAESGNPEDLAKAASARSNYFNQITSGLAANAERRAAEARARLGDFTPGAKEIASRDMFDALEGAMREARRVESSLWDQVPQNVRLESVNTLNAAQTARRDLLLDGVEDIPGVVGRFVGLVEDLRNQLPRLRAAEQPDLGEIRRLSQQLQQLQTSGAVQKLRSRALSEAKEFRAASKFTAARVMDDIAEGALEDLSTVGGDAFDAARDYSRAFNDAFTRTFAGKALKSDRAGAQRISPELLLHQAFGAGGGPRAAERFRDIRTAAAFASRDAGDNFLQPVLSAQERFLRGAAAELVDPQTGRVTPERLTRFRQANETLLNDFPRLSSELADVDTAERAVRLVAGVTSRATRRMKSIDAIARLSSNEEPVRAVTAMLKGRAPLREYTSMARLAKRSGPGAVNGLRAATIDYALSEATTGGVTSFTKMSNVLLRPISKGGPPLLKFMRSQGVIDGDSAARLLKIVKKGREIEGRAAARVNVDEPDLAPDAFTDMLTRIAGAKLATAGTSATGRSESLIAAAAGSRFLRNVFQNVPIGRTRDLLVEAVENPQLMAELLQATGKDALKSEAAIRRLNSVLVRAALVPQDELEE